MDRGAPFPHHDAVPGHGQRLRHAHQHVRGHRRHGQPDGAAQGEGGLRRGVRRRQRHPGEARNHRGPQTTAAARGHADSGFRQTQCILVRLVLWSSGAAAPRRVTATGPRGPRGVVAGPSPHVSASETARGASPSLSHLRRRASRSVGMIGTMRRGRCRDASGPLTYFCSWPASPPCRRVVVPVVDFVVDVTGVLRPAVGPVSVPHHPPSRGGWGGACLVFRSLRSALRGARCSILDARGAGRPAVFLFRGR